MTPSSEKSPSPLPWRRLLLPSEHGSWAFVLEPLLLGLLVAFSPAALWLTLAVVLGFVARKPAKFALAPEGSSSRALRNPARTILLALAVTATAALAAAVATSDWKILIPIAVALPGLLVFARQEQDGQTRSLGAELVATSLCSLPLVSIVLADGQPVSRALVLGFVSLARAWPSLLFVRARLRTTRGETGHLATALSAQVFAPLLLVLLAQQKLMPLAIAALNLALSVRAVFFLLSPKPQLTAKQLGMMEVVWGLLYTAGAAFLCRG